MYSIGQAVEIINSYSSFYKDKGIIVDIHQTKLGYYYKIDVNEFKSVLFREDEIKPYTKEDSDKFLDECENTLNKICTCIMHGPTGLMAVGCQCGGK